jgi:hypothetical protein
MRAHAKHHLMIPALVVLAFVIGMSCSPRAIAVGGSDGGVDAALLV